MTLIYVENWSNILKFMWLIVVGFLHACELRTENSQINLHSEQKFLKIVSLFVIKCKTGGKGGVIKCAHRVGVQLEMVRRYFSWETLMLSNVIATITCGYLIKIKSGLTFHCYWASVLSSHLWLLTSLSSDTHRDHFHLCRKLWDSAAHSNLDHIFKSFVGDSWGSICHLLLGQLVPVGNCVLLNGLWSKAHLSWNFTSSIYQFCLKALDTFLW